MKYHSPDTLYPVAGSKSIVYLKNIISSSLITVGGYTCYEDPDDVHNFEKNVLYHQESTGDKLIIRKFCNIQAGVRFIMNAANYAAYSVSTYPFEIFGEDWSIAHEQTTEYDEDGTYRIEISEGDPSFTMMFGSAMGPPLCPA